MTRSDDVGRVCGSVLIVRSILLITCLVVWVLPVQAQWGNWPGWRGNGNGVSQETNLPVEWSELDYRWKTRIPGTGNSSPIVWGPQVFVTTSVERPVTNVLGVGLQWAAVVAGAVVAASIAIPLVLLLLHRGRRDDRDSKGPLWFRLVVGLEGVAMVALTAFFFWSLSNLLLNRHAEFTPEQPDLAWIIAGEPAMLGLIAAVGSLGVRSWWRLGGVVFLAGVGGVFYVFQPPTVSTAPVPLEWQVNVLRPLAIGVGWLLVAWLGARLIGYRDRRPVSPVAYVVRPASIFLIAALGFAFFNVVEPQLGGRREVWALDRNSGEVLWQSGISAPTGRKWHTNTYATPTPVTNGAYVVADFGPVMIAMDISGKIIWTRNEPLYMTYLRYGAAASPVIYRDRLIYSYIPENPNIEQGEITGERAYLTALDLATGEEMWRVDGIEGGHDAYGAPLLAGC